MRGSMKCWGRSDGEGSFVSDRRLLTVPPLMLGWAELVGLGVLRVVVSLLPLPLPLLLTSSSSALGSGCRAGKSGAVNSNAHNGGSGAANSLGAAAASCARRQSECTLACTVEPATGQPSPTQRAWKRWYTLLALPTKTMRKIKKTAKLQCAQIDTNTAIGLN